MTLFIGILLVILLGVGGCLAIGLPVLLADRFGLLNFTKERFWLLAVKSDDYGSTGLTLTEIVWCSTSTGEVYWSGNWPGFHPRWQPDHPLLSWKPDLLLDLLEGYRRGIESPTKSHRVRRMWKKFDLSWFTPVIEGFAKGEAVSRQEVEAAAKAAGRSGTVHVLTLAEMQRMLRGFPALPKHDPARNADEGLARWNMEAEDRKIPYPPLPEHFDPDNHWLLAAVSGMEGNNRYYELAHCSIPQGRLHITHRPIQWEIYHMDWGPGASWTFAELGEILETPPPNANSWEDHAQKLWKRLRLEWFTPVLQKLAAGESVTHTMVDKAHRDAHEGRALRLYPGLAPGPVKDEWETEMIYDEKRDNRALQ